MNALSFKSTEHLLHQIEQNNKEKPEAPLALVIQAEFDENQSLYSQASFHNILEISKTYQVAMKIIGLKSLWGQIIQQTAESWQKDIALLFVVMHGNSKRLICGKGEYLNISDFQEEDFSLLSPLAPIMLVACKAGLILAPHLAKIAKRTVFASKEDFHPARTLFAGCFAPPKFLCYDESNNLLTRVYFPNGKSMFLHVNEQLTKQLFCEKFEYLKALASNGDPLAEIDIADMFNRGIYVERSIELALNYYTRAAEKGLMQAQVILGALYKSGRDGILQSNERAFYWLKKAAEQGHPAAQNAIAHDYHLGANEIAQSDEMALYWYKKAAEQMNANAIFNLGIFFEEGRGGLSQSDEKALTFYDAAAKLGHSKALLMMSIFHETGRGGLLPSKEEALRYYRLIPEPEKIEHLRKKIKAMRIKQG